MKGNHAKVWEQLIDNKKLPYMAMLRNLRNMIQCGISEKHHQWVIKKLQDEGAVVNSKQFPFRFFTAYEVLDELEKDYSEWIAFLGKGEELPRKNKAKNKKQDKKNKKLANGDFKYDTNILNRYKTALDNALKVATTFNISPIKGSTAIFVNIDEKMFGKSTPAAKRLGKSVTSIGQIGALLALMFKYSCEKSNLVTFNSFSCLKNIGLEEGTILDNMKSLTSPKLLTRISFKEVLEELLESREHYDNLIILSSDSDSATYVPYLQKFLRKYRTNVNSELLFVNVDLGSSDCALAEDADFDHMNDVKICGYSDSILRFVAERGNQGQLVYIENIHRFVFYLFLLFLSFEQCTPSYLRNYTFLFSL
jgi:telomerase protein component 1